MSCWGITEISQFTQEVSQALGRLCHTGMRVVEVYALDLDRGKNYHQVNLDIR